MSTITVVKEGYFQNVEDSSSFVTKPWAPPTSKSGEPFSAEQSISSKELLCLYQDAVYTAARTYHLHSIVNFKGQMERLLSSVRKKVFGTTVHMSAKEKPIPSENIESDHVLNSMKPFRQEVSLLLSVKSLLQTSCQECVHLLASKGQTPQELKITLLLAYDAKEKLKGNGIGKAICHVQSMEPPPQEPCIVQIGGTRRTVPHIKASAWVSERKQIEDKKKQDCNEVLLWDPSTTDIYEGTQSNFAVILKQGNEEYLQTAPLESVLKGTILDLVIQICHRENIRIDFSFPKCSEISLWQGAFVSSTSRLILEIGLVRAVDGAEYHLPTSSPLITKLKTCLQKDIEQSSEKVWEQV